MKPIRVLIADDDPLVRSGLEVILGNDEGFRVVVSVGDGRQAVDGCRGRNIDVALLDVRMPILDGVAAAREIAASTSTRCLILSTFEEDDLVRDAVDAGARGYLLKGKTAEEIKESVRLVHRGIALFDMSVFERLQDSRPAPPPGDEDLSGREREVALLIAEGFSNREIADRLYLSEGTVKNHVTAILDKLGLKQRTQIAVSYLRSR
jgi:DNA-binding NarL/FixJ family response regulator